MFLLLALALLSTISYADEGGARRVLESGTVAPVTAAPVTAAPVTTAPVTSVTTAPVTSVTTAPVTSAPVTTAPVTTAPVTIAPVTPGTGAPVTGAPVTGAPVTNAPIVAITGAPVTNAPIVAITGAPVTDAPVTNAPVTDAPVTNAPVTDAPVTPVTNAPIVAITGAPVTPVTNAPVATSAPVTAAPVTQDTKSCGPNQYFFEIKGSGGKVEKRCKSGEPGEQFQLKNATVVSGKYSDLAMLQCGTDPDKIFVISSVCVSNSKSCVNNEGNAGEDYSITCQIAQEKQDKQHSCHDYNFWDYDGLACPSISKMSGVCLSQSILESTAGNLNPYCGEKLSAPETAADKMGTVPAQIQCCQVLALQTKMAVQKSIEVCTKPYPQASQKGISETLRKTWDSCQKKKFIQVVKADENNFKGAPCELTSYNSPYVRMPHKSEISNFVKDNEPVTADTCARICARSKPIDLSTYRSAEDTNDKHKCIAFEVNTNGGCELFYETLDLCQEARVKPGPGETAYPACEPMNREARAKRTDKASLSCYRFYNLANRVAGPLAVEDNTEHIFNIVWPIIVVLLMPILCYINHTIAETKREEHERVKEEAEIRMQSNYKRTSLANVHYGVEVETSGQQRLQLASKGALGGTRQKPGSFRQEDGHLYSMQSMVNMESEMDHILKTSNESAVTPAHLQEPNLTAHHSDNEVDEFQTIEEPGEEKTPKLPRKGSEI